VRAGEEAGRRGLCIVWGKTAPLRLRIFGPPRASVVGMGMAERRAARRWFGRGRSPRGWGRGAAEQRRVKSGVKYVSRVRLIWMCATERCGSGCSGLS
jgi:hypothetical protein